VSTSTSTSTDLLPGRPGLRRTVRDCLTMARRAVLTVRYSPEQLSDVTVQPIIFTLMFTYIFGGAIAGDSARYLPFFIPGILVQSVIMTSAATGVQLREDMSTGVFDRFRSLPIARIAPLGGAMLADLLRYALGCVVTLGVGAAMGYRPAGGVVGLAAACLLVAVCAVALSWLFAFFGVVARSAASVQNTSMLVMFVLTFVSNAFVPAASMPGWLQPVVAVNPVSHLVTAARALADGQGWTGDVLWALAGAGAVVAVFAPLTLRRYMRRA
jgi:ABC-2 type transport system permease protein